MMPNVKRIRNVSIPFIAGQWSLLLTAPLAARRGAGKFQSPSLRGSGRFAQRVHPPTSPRPGFNPLHCGAVVASSPRANPTGGSPLGFNPLHCGAVVASRTRRRARREARHVSIPFIAGQWSLPIGFDNEYITSSKFQSPSLRGSGRFEIAPRRMAEGQGGFQSPSLRGSGRFARRGARRTTHNRSINPLHCGAVVASGKLSIDHALRTQHVSIPFIAGQWSLLWVSHNARWVDGYLFQSPSLRGSGRFTHPLDKTSSQPPCFNPLHCGAVVASLWFTFCMIIPIFVSIPFIAGQWSLRSPFWWRAD